MCIQCVLSLDHRKNDSIISGKWNVGPKKAETRTIRWNIGETLLHTYLSIDLLQSCIFATVNE